MKITNFDPLFSLIPLLKSKVTIKTRPIIVASFGNRALKPDRLDNLVAIFNLVCVFLTLFNKIHAI